MATPADSWPSWHGAYSAFLPQQLVCRPTCTDATHVCYRCLIKILTNIFKFSLARVFAGGERNFSAWGRIWSKDRNRLLVGRVAMLVYIYFNQRVLNRNYNSGLVQDWDAFLSHLENKAPIVVPQGNHAAGLPDPSLLPFRDIESCQQQASLLPNGKCNSAIFSLGTEGRSKHLLSYSGVVIEKVEKAEQVAVAAAADAIEVQASSLPFASAAGVSAADTSEAETTVGPSSGSPLTCTAGPCGLEASSSADDALAEVPGDAHTQHSYNIDLLGRCMCSRKCSGVQCSKAQKLILMAVRALT